MKLDFSGINRAALKQNWPRILGLAYRVLSNVVA